MDDSLNLRFWRTQSGIWSAYGAALMVPWIGKYPLAVMIPNKLAIASAGILVSGALRRLYLSARLRGPLVPSTLGVAVVASLVAGVVFQLLLVAIFPDVHFSSLVARQQTWLPELGGIGYHSILMLAWSLGYLGLRGRATAVEAPAQIQPPAERRPTLDTIAVLDGRVLVRDGGRTIILDPHEIEFLSADGDYVRVHTATKPLLVRTTMAHVARILDGSTFARIHRSTIVNVRCVRELVAQPNADVVVVLKTGAKLKASRSYSRQLRTTLGLESNS